MTVTLCSHDLVLVLQNFSRYLAFKRDNNELLVFLLRQLLHEQTSYLRSRYGGTDHEPAAVAETDLLDRVKYLNAIKITAG